MPEQAPEIEAIRREALAGGPITNAQAIALINELDRVSGTFDQIAGAVLRYHREANIPARRKS